MEPPLYKLPGEESDFEVFAIKDIAFDSLKVDQF